MDDDDDDVSIVCSVRSSGLLCWRLLCFRFKFNEGAGVRLRHIEIEPARTTCFARAQFGESYRMLECDDDICILQCMHALHYWRNATTDDSLLTYLCGAVVILDD
jgi:hypothetical protein